MSHPYPTIERAINYLVAHQHLQPSLGDLAAHVGLSESHLHRMFSEWAGVTPKDFLQCLTAAHARSVLQRGESVLDAALSCGLSGPGRLHDLCVNIEAATPGEVKSGGAGLTLEHGFAPTPFGLMHAALAPRGIAHLALIDNEAQAVTYSIETLSQRWPRAKLNHDDASAASLANRLFAPLSLSHKEQPKLRAWLQGSAFQLKVWQALVALPEGALCSYARLGQAVNAPRAARAVGSAVAANPVAFLIPCHRVIRATGVVGDYRWGSARKRALLAWEGARSMAH